MTDSRELANYGEGGAIAERRTTSTAIAPADRLAMLREALTNPDVDPAKAQAMFSLMNQMEDRERQAEFNRDKARVLREMPAIFKGGRSDKHRYAKFEDMHRAALPVLARNHLSIDFRVGSEGNMITVQPVLRHENGYVEEGAVMKGPADTGPGRSQIQSLGSSSSYLKRYTMKGMLNIIEDGEDNDGAAIGRDGYQLNDRQQGLIVDAQSAAERGEYVAFYQGLKAPDKAFLVTSGTHARLGGNAALPSASARRSDPPAAKQEQQRAPAAETAERPDVTTPEGWTRQYELDCAAAPDIAALNDVIKRGKGGVSRLEQDGPQALFDRTLVAVDDARDRINGGE